MADNYTQFSEVLADLTDPEQSWLKDQFKIICVVDGKEYPVDELPADCKNKKPEWRGCRGLRDYPDYDPSFIEEPEFRFELSENDEDDEWGRHLWIYSEDHGNIDQVCHFIQKFLKQFRPHDCWSLTFSASCSKPRIGEFSGGAVFVTAEAIRWDNAEAFIEREKAAFVERRIDKPQELTDAGPTIVLNVAGGIVQDVFCSALDANVLIVDWDMQENDPSSPGVVNLELDGRSCIAFVSESQAHPFGKLLNTDVEKAIRSAIQQGVLEKPLPPT